MTNRPFLDGEMRYTGLLKRGGAIITFYRWDVQQSFRNELVQSKWNVKSQIIWDKQSHGMGDLNGEYAPQHENMLFATEPGFSFPNGRPKTIISFPKIAAENLIHPNEKPVGLLTILINQLTVRENQVLDIFMGSGTTLVAAQNEGRRAVGIELSEEYCKIAVERLRQPSFFSIPRTDNKTLHGNTNLGSNSTAMSQQKLFE